MSFSHKAYVFDYDAFTAGLLPIVLRALETASSADLEGFIESHRSALVDLEAKPLDSSWRSKVASDDVQAHADLALTKYYDLTDDIGLAGEWQEVSEQLERLGLPPALILGVPLEQGGVFLDPGSMGSYFQSAATVRSNLRLLDAAASQASESETIAEARRLLEPAAELGLYVTF